MKVVWDLDGVLRDLSGHIARKHGAPYPTEWSCKFDGKSICQCVNEDLNILLEAPSTGYLKIALQFCPVPTIWTSQPENWRPNTLKWVKQHIGTAIVEFKTPEEKAKGVQADDNVLLIEDSPNFKCYDRILLIERPYNQEPLATRVFGGSHLKNLLELIK